MNNANSDNAYNTFIELYKDSYNTAFPKTKMCQEAIHKTETVDDFQLIKIVTNKIKTTL